MTTCPVLVTGGAGFIGSHTCKQLFYSGFAPLVIDDLRTGNRRSVRSGDLVTGDVLDTVAGGSSRTLSSRLYWGSRSRSMEMAVRRAPSATLTTSSAASMLSDVDGPVNIGNPGEFTVEELAQLVLELTGSKSQLARLPVPVDDPKRRRPDITKAREALG